MKDKTREDNSEKNIQSPEYKAAISTLTHLIIEVHDREVSAQLKLEGDKTKNQKETHTDIKTRLETNIRALENERASILGHIERKALTPDQIQDLYDFANAAAKRLEVAEEDSPPGRRLLKQSI